MVVYLVIVYIKRNGLVMFSSVNEVSVMQFGNVSIVLFEGKLSFIVGVVGVFQNNMICQKDRMFYNV